MPRPRGRRRIERLHGPRRFKPQGIPAKFLEEIVLSQDELEAIRLADLEGLYQDQAAERMGISRATLGRILTQAHGKVANALVSGKVLRIGDEPLPVGSWRFICQRCGHVWEESEPPSEQIACPACGETVLETWTPGGHCRRHPGRGRYGGRQADDRGGFWSETAEQTGPKPPLDGGDEE